MLPHLIALVRRVQKYFVPHSLIRSLSGRCETVFYLLSTKFVFFFFCHLHMNSRCLSLALSSASVSMQDADNTTRADDIFWFRKRMLFGGKLLFKNGKVGHILIGTRRALLSISIGCSPCDSKNPHCIAYSLLKFLYIATMTVLEIPKAHITKAIVSEIFIVSIY